MKVLDKVYDRHLQRQEMTQISQAIKQDYLIVRTGPCPNFSEYLRSDSAQIQRNPIAILPRIFGDRFLN